MAPSATLPSASDAAAALSSYQAPSSADLLSSAQNQYGVNDLQSRVSSLQGLTGNLSNAIAAVDPSVTAETSGSMTTEGQRAALSSAEQAPLVTELNGVDSNLGTAEGNLQTAQTSASNEANAEETDAQNKEQQLLDVYNTANEQQQESQSQQNTTAQEKEAEREFNVSAADNTASASTSTAATKAAAVGHISQQLSSLKGGDGKVSEQTWAGALNDALAAGYSASEFWQDFGQYVNGNYANTYAGWQAGYGNKYATAGKK